MSDGGEEGGAPASGWERNAAKRERERELRENKVYNMTCRFHVLGEIISDVLQHPS
jgi:hypothetical protein